MTEPTGTTPTDCTNRPVIERLASTTTDSVEGGAGFDQSHAGIGEAEIVTDLAYQHVTDEVVKVDAVPEGGFSRVPMIDKDE